jgi:hypothetical protein
MNKMIDQIGCLKVKNGNLLRIGGIHLKMSKITNGMCH